MCDQYFCIDDHQQQKLQHDTGRPEDFDGQSVGSKTSQNVKLHEMEEQLEIAENRCNTLKDQLDQMKKLYQTKTDSGRSTNRSPIPIRKIPELKKNKALPTRTCNDFKDCSGDKNASDKSSTPVLLPSCNDLVPHTTISPTGSTINKTATIKEITLVRQNSQAISTDTSGAAVQTINNILNGITDSVNRLSQLHVKLEYDKPSGARKPKKVKDSACGDDQPPELIPCLESVPDNNEEQIQDDVQKSSVASLQSKGNTTKRKNKRKQNPNKSLQHSTISVNITAKKSIKSTAKHVEKKFKMEPVKMVKHDSSSILAAKAKKPPTKRFKTPSREKFRQRNPKPGVTDTDKLVEIYHNIAAKDTDSDESGKEDVEKKKSKDGKLRKSSISEFNSEMVPVEENCSDVDQRSSHVKSQLQMQQRFFHNGTQADLGMINYQRQLSPIDENTYTEPNAPRMRCYSNYVTCSKNYELPTIASKMKQVAKSYLRQFNLKAIPFCPAKSTSPSHNIGINIQQVMNIIKTRQPITGISPTLAHNIGLAAEKLHNRSVSAMASSLGSKAGYDRVVCPLNRHSMNYQQLQEMAKEIPEEPDEEENMESGASGDTNRIFKWTSDPTKQKNCTCIPHRGVDFQQVYNKYQGNVYSTSTITQPGMRTRCRYAKQPWRLRPKPCPAKLDKLPLDAKPSSVLKGKEKNLKDVLTNLHNEFAYLNAEYESLTTKISEMGNDADEEILKQLENMEKCLNNKEEEITMVMALYKEVVALKQQVKVLKNKASIASVALTQHQQQMQMQQLQQMQHQQIPQQQMQRFRDYNDPHAAIHLTKLLRQIQMYQEMNRVGRRC